MFYGANPYILFLILILLVMGSDPEAGKKIEMVKNVMDRMNSAMNNFRAGITSLATDFEEIHLIMQGVNNPGEGRK